LDEFPLSALVIAFVVLLILSAFFSLSETAMMAINRYRLRHRARSGHVGALRVERLLTRTDKLLGTILLGNNLINSAAAVLVSVITVRLLGSSELALTVATLGVTFAILVFSEITPKVIAATYPEQVAYPASLVLNLALRLFQPAVWFVNLFSRGLLWLLRVKPRHGGEAQAISIEEMHTLVQEAGQFAAPTHRRLLLNLLELEDITVNDVMTPRNQIEAIDIDADPALILEQLSTAHHTRLPVYQGRLDNIVGITHLRRVLYPALNGELTLDELRETLQEAYFIPSGAPLFTQLKQFQEQRQRMGLVVDEYGELLGLIGMEDLLEEIVGEFTTQAPGQSSRYRKQEDGSWLVEGGSLVRDLNRKLGLELPTEGPRTLNGLVLEQLEAIPEAGVSLKVGAYPVEVVQTQGRAVKLARIYPALPAPEEADR
jgi:Mg2+/Co2+ transporter CorB